MRVPIEEKESYRWLENLRQSTTLFGEHDRCVHIGDRESDIYELFCLADELKTHFLVRTCVNRLAVDGHHTIEQEMAQEKAAGLHNVRLRDQQGREITTNLEVKYRRLAVLPLIGKQKKYAAQILTVIHAQEQQIPDDRERVEWKLITNLPIDTLDEAAEKLNWYAMRWKIETFHKILKSGCRAEESKLRTP